MRKMLKVVKCNICRVALVDQKTSFVQGNDFLLLRLKQKGGLVVPSCDTITVVATTERHLRDICNLRTSPHPMLLKLQYAVLQDVGLKAFSVEHAKETSVAIDNHAFSLIKTIVKVFSTSDFTT